MWRANEPTGCAGKAGEDENEDEDGDRGEDSSTRPCHGPHGAGAMVSSSDVMVDSRLHEVHDESAATAGSRRRLWRGAGTRLLVRVGRRRALAAELPQPPRSFDAAENREEARKRMGRGGKVGKWSERVEARPPDLRLVTGVGADFLCFRTTHPQDEKQQRIKITSLGPAASGKSCLIKRYCESRFVSK